MTEEDPPGPLPVPTEDDREFWEATRRGEFVLPRCRRCSYTWFPPYGACPVCRSTDLAWDRVCGKGEVFGVAVFERQYLRSFPVPYHVVLVRLEEGPLVYGDIVDAGAGGPTPGDAVRICFDDVDGRMALPRFRMATG